jgi:hypothetical protein
MRLRTDHQIGAGTSIPESVRDPRVGLRGAERLIRRRTPNLNGVYQRGPMQMRRITTIASSDFR